MEEKISVTFKAGTGYDVPWIVLKAESIEEMHADLSKVQALFEVTSYLGKAFAESYKGAPVNAAALIKEELGAEVVSYGPPATPAVPEFLAPPANVPTPAWQPPAVPSGGGWTPPERDFWIIEVPRDKSELWGGPKGPDGKAVKGGGMRGQLQAGGIQIDWNAAEKRNTIPKNADEGALAFIRGQGIELK